MTTPSYEQESVFVEATPKYLLVDLEMDMVVAGADEETELLPHAAQWASEEEFTPGSLVIYERKSILEI